VIWPITSKSSCLTQVKIYQKLFIGQFSLGLGHIQIAQVPDRHEPDSDGEINYGYVWDLLQKANYDGFVGLEYFPKNGTCEGLGWMKNL